MIKKKKLKPISSLKKKAWKVFSLYIRTREANDRGLVACVTCGDVKHYTAGHAGHFLHGHSKATFLDDRNVHFQCIKCNHFLSGNLIEYAEFMKKKYGWDTVDALRELSKQIWKPSRTELESIISHYQELTKNVQ